jgi:hypothetical protein
MVGGLDVKCVTLGQEWNRLLRDCHVQTFLPVSLVDQLDVATLVLKLGRERLSLVSIGGLGTRTVVFNGRVGACSILLVVIGVKGVTLVPNERQRLLEDSLLNRRLKFVSYPEVMP